MAYEAAQKLKGTNIDIALTLEALLKDYLKNSNNTQKTDQHPKQDNHAQVGLIGLSLLRDSSVNIVYGHTSPSFAIAYYSNDSKPEVRVIII